jgi:uncharacterized protein
MSGKKHGADSDDSACESIERARSGGGSRKNGLDVFAFARFGKSTQGSVAIQCFFRLLEGLPDQPTGEAGLVKWSARGEIGNAGRMHRKPLLHIQVQANPVLECQRCNALFVYPINMETVLQLVKSEADLDDDFASDQQDANYEEDQPEKVLGSQHFNLLEQVEDELILSVPYVSKHDVCVGQPVVAHESPQEIVVKRPSPFAVLEQLKNKD